MTPEQKIDFWTTTFCMIFGTIAIYWVLMITVFVLIMAFMIFLSSGGNGGSGSSTNFMVFLYPPSSGPNNLILQNGEIVKSNNSILKKQTITGGLIQNPSVYGIVLALGVVSVGLGIYHLYKFRYVDGEDDKTQ